MATAHFVIVGGGTAGWLTAFILQDSARRAGLELRISVVESSKIPTVGVGEASTAALRVFFQHFGIDEFEFFRETGATFKPGIRHNNRRRKGYTCYDRSTIRIRSWRRRPARSPTISTSIASPPAGRCRTCTCSGRCWSAARRPMRQFLKRKSKGVEIVDAVVAGVERDPESGDIAALVTDDGMRLAADFFIDATGFRKRIVVQDHRYWVEEGERWESFWISMSGQEAVRIRRTIQAAAGPVFRLGPETIGRIAGCCLRPIEGNGEMPGAARRGYQAACALFDDVFGSQNPLSEPDDDNPLRRVVEHIRRNLDKPLTVAELAAVSGFSRSHFSRMLAATEGVPRPSTCSTGACATPHGS